MGLVSELRRRNVFRVALAYILVAWLILQAGDTLAPALRLPDWVNTAVAFFLILGFPLAVFFAWAYELTPEGIKPEKHVNRSQSNTHLTGRKLDYLIIVVLSVALIFLVFDKFVLDPDRDAGLVQATPETVGGQVAGSGISGIPAKSVAVLPFVAMSNGPDDEYFADGLSEEILNSLSQLPELRVVARTSSFFFKGKDYLLSEIAERLGVAYVVEGSVRRTEETLRITAQLIRTSDVSQIWSKNYDEERSNVLTVQTDVAEHIAAALGVLLDDEARQRMRAIHVNDVDVFIAYQKGLEAYAKAHDPGTDKDFFEELAVANAYFDTVLEAQPNLSAARVLRADRASHVLLRLISGRREEPSPGEVNDAAEALQAELDFAWRAAPYGNQRDILNLERTLVSDDWTGLSTLIQRAIQPGNCPRINTTEFLPALGFAQELATKLEESLACNPLDADVINRLARTLAWAGRPEEALALLDRAEANGVIAQIFIYRRVFILAAAGRFDDPEVQSYLKAQPEIRMVIQGKLAEARQMAELYWANPDASLGRSLDLAALVGDRARANEFAARIDAYPGSALKLLMVVRGPCMTWAGIAQGCRHGIPFDLDATPNFKARVEESGLPWPPIALRDASTEDSTKVTTGE